MSTTWLTASASQTTVRTQSAARYAGLDLARLAAAYSIVWLHATRLPALEPTKALGRFAVPFFVFATVLLVFEGVRRHPERSFADYARGRLGRIYLPFLAWSGVYLAFKAVKAILLPEQANDWPGWSILWLGSFYHLWFMPFVLAVSLLAFALARAVADRPHLQIAVAAIAAAAGAGVACGTSPEVLGRLSEYGQLLTHALPAVLWALALAIAVRRRGPALWDHPAAFPAAVLLLAAGTALVWQGSPWTVAAENLAGLGALILAMRPVASPWLIRLAKLGPLAYGIYLAHLLGIKVLESLAGKLGLGLSWQEDVAIFVLSAAGSTLLAWLLSRWGRTRWLVA